MDKQKQIEEMAKLIVSINNNDYMYDNDGHKRLNFADADKIAEELLKYYQPKIPEGAVVFNSYKDFTAHNYGYYLQGRNAIIEEIGKGNVVKQKCVIDFENEIRKETAEKFAEKLKDYYNWGFPFNLTISDKKKLFSYIDEICKDISEGKV